MLSNDLVDAYTCFCCDRQGGVKQMPCGRKRKKQKIKTHKRKKRLRRDRHKKKGR
jgi:hypothetical protein